MTMLNYPLDINKIQSSFVNRFSRYNIMSYPDNSLYFKSRNRNMILKNMIKFKSMDPG